MNAPVVVVGAGPSGVTAAILLAQAGVEVLVLDRWSEVFPQPRAVHLDDEVYRILGRLGVADEFAAISRPALGLRLQDADHRPLAEFRRAPGDGRHGYPQASMFDQPELEVLLRTHLHQQASVRFRGDVEVTGVRQEEGLVRVELTDRVTGEPESVEASYVLGCDGAASVVRASIGVAMEDLCFEQRWLVVDVNTDRDLGHWEGVHQVCDTRRAATYMRIGERRHRWEFQLLGGEGSADFADVAALRPLVGPWTAAVADDELELVRVAEYTFRAQLADRWRDRRVFLLGDAAHLTPPFIGQGMGAGLRDAANLSWKLAGVLAGTLAEPVLDTYEQERRPHARQMVRLAIGVGTAMTRGGRWGDVARRVVAPRLHLVPGLRARVLDSATPRLGAGSLVRRSRRSRLVGTLCPNALVDGTRRFDDVAGGRFAVVAVGVMGDTARQHALGRGAVVVEALPGEPLHDWLVAGRARVAVVRPDGTVLACPRSAAEAATELVSLVPTTAQRWDVVSRA